MRGLATVFLLLLSFHAFSQVDHWETIIKANEQWSYFLGTTTPVATEPASNWRTLAFDDSGWAQGAGGIGYGDGDDGTTLDVSGIQVMSVFLRKKFTVVDKSKIESAILSVDYDDGFIAYLNGTEIARANMDGRGDFPPYNTASNGFGDEALVNPLPFSVDNQKLQTAIIQGENVLAVQVHNENASSSDLTSNVYFSVGINDASFTYQTTPPWFTAPAVFSSDLPILIINTTGSQPIPDDPKIVATMGVIDNGPGNRNQSTDPFNNYNGYIAIETRGESSQMFPKKSYSLETQDATGENINVELLGFPAENDWILYAPYTDKTMMRNEITFKLSRDIGRYASRTRACEVILNGDYQGVYTLMERIKVDDGRVNIASLNPEEVTGDDLTGGYILRVDKIDGNDYPAWNSGGLDFQYFDPAGEDLVAQQQVYIQNFISAVNSSINGAGFANPETGYARYIDVASFVDNMLISELGLNVDGYRFSTYMYKDKDSKGGKLVLGPLWDFNLAYGNVDYNTAVQSPTNAFGNPAGGWLYKDFRMFWFPRLMSDPNFQNKMKTRWTSLRENKLSNTRITFLIDSMATSLEEAQVRNYERWPILGTYVWPNQYIGNTYAQEVAWFKNWIISRANWMDTNMPGTIVDPDPVTGIDDEFVRAGVSVYPNPGNDVFTIEWSNPSFEQCRVEIINALGQQVFASVENGSSVTWRTTSSQRSVVNAGVYFVRVTNTRGTNVVKKLVKL